MDDTGQSFTTKMGNGVAGGDFKFLFSLLPGDYNQDGIVNGLDTVTAAVQDGDGDNVVENGSTADDTAIASANAGWELPFRKTQGDYKDDEKIDGDSVSLLLDYGIWRSTFGSTTDLRADGDKSGVIDTPDYNVWRHLAPSYSAWYQGPHGAGVALDLVDFGSAPRVANVTVSGSTSTHSPYSFATHVGSGAQLQTVPVGAADTISITFSEDVNIVASNLYVVGLRTANVPTVVDFSYDIATMTATWRFANLFANDQYAISLSDVVTDIEGNNLDGEWVNPATTTTTNSLVSVFPSGDGSAGGRFNFVFTIMAGDANRNNLVDGTDYGVLSVNYGNYVSNATFSQGDSRATAKLKIRTTTFGPQNILNTTTSRHLKY
jgi:hypothetical protein